MKTLILWSMLWLVTLASVRADEVSVLCVIRPWIADGLQMTAEQRAAVRRSVAAYQLDIASNIGQYPKGGQDNEGEHERRRLEKSIAGSRSTAIAAIQALLTDEQKKQLLAVIKADQPTLEASLRLGVFADLLRPEGVSELQLSSAQQSRLRALILQAEDDFLRPHDDSDAQLKVVRQQIQEGLTTILTEEQKRQGKGPPERREAAKPQVIYGQRLFASFEANQKRGGGIGLKAEDRHTPGRASSLVEWPFQKAIGEAQGQPPRLRSSTDGRETRPPRWIWHPEDELVRSVVLSPDRRWAVSIGSTAQGLKSSVEIRLWDARTGKLMSIAEVKGPGYRASVEFVTSECFRFIAEPFGR